MKYQPTNSSNQDLNSNQISEKPWLIRTAPSNDPPISQRMMILYMMISLSYQYISDKIHIIYYFIIRNKR